MDLLQEYTDEQIWIALEKVRMREKFDSNGTGLDTEVLAYILTLF